MSSTEVIGVRVSDGYKQRFADLCDKIGATPREVMENLVDDYFRGSVSFSGGHIENGLLTGVEDDFDDGEYRKFGFNNIVRLLRKKGYPDSVIKGYTDSLVERVYEMPNYNPRRARDFDCGC